MKKNIDILLKNAVHEFTFVDVGAKGSLEYIKEFAGKTHMHAFEPNPEEYQALCKKYTGHHFKSLALSQTGLSDYKGKASFFINHHSSMSSLLESDEKNYKRHFGLYNEYETWKRNISNRKEINIDVDTLDNYFRESSSVIDYLKIDTQGSELSVLKGAKNLIGQQRIQIIKLEVSTIPVYKNQALFADIDVYLRQSGYNLVDFITYRNDYQSVFDRRAQQPHFSACGDAIYVLSDNLNNERAIRSGIVLSWLGYSGLAESILKEAGLNNAEHNLQNFVDPINHVPVYKRLFKNITPPFIWQLFKKIWR